MVLVQNDIIACSSNSTTHIISRINFRENVPIKINRNAFRLTVFDINEVGLLSEQTPIRVLIFVMNI